MILGGGGGECVVFWWGVGAVLAALKAPWQRFGRSGRSLGALRSALGGLWEALGDLLSSLGCLWESSWGNLGDPWGATTASGALLESSLDPLGII